MAKINTVFLLGTVHLWPKRLHRPEFENLSATMLRISTDTECHDCISGTPHTVFATGKLGDWCMRMLTPGSLIHIEGSLFSPPTARKKSPFNTLVRAAAIQLVTTAGQMDSPNRLQAFAHTPFHVHLPAMSLH
ncbi:hypothetical protein [Oleidesulfovibrio sp.]|uniref:hypothetical protein n=1 Tax=Oleidesulfovibrio sp. TaxID=2909707 RepID=UPI003A87A375